MTTLRIAVVTLCLCSVGVAGAQSSAEFPVTKPGLYELTLPESGRRFTLIIPEGYTGQAAVPLVLSLHYGGNVTPYSGRGLLESLLEPAFRDLGAVMVAPDSAAGNWANPTSEQHVLELLNYIEANYNIDANRTLLTGYSMGGSGTWYLAPRHPSRFRAAVVMAGRPQADTTDFDWNTPTYVIHSSADEVVPLDSTENAVERLLRQDAPIDLVVVNGITHYEIPRYRSHLNDALPWVQQVWAAQ